MANTPLEELDPKDYIIIKGAKENNLQNIDVAIARNQLTVITGVSGSGKSSLAFDTLYAEGQRMYVESLSSYARQFLGRMEKPEVEYIKGVSPAIAIEQKVTTKNPRSTVGTSTEIYDYLKLLYARIGRTISPVSGKNVKKHTTTNVVDFILTKEEGTKVMIFSPFQKREERTIEQELELLLQNGFTRVSINGDLIYIEDLIKDLPKDTDTINVLIDRISVKNDEETQFRLADSVQIAFYEGHGDCIIDIVKDKQYNFSDRFELDGILFEEPSTNFFSFNNPYGACKTCEGFGHVLGVDPDLVIPDKNKSIYEGAIAPWRSEKMNKWVQPLIQHGVKFDFPIHRPYEDLNEEQKAILWTGNKYFQGLNDFFAFLEEKIHKIQFRVMLSRYRGRTSCPDCHGTRLRKDAGYVKIQEKSIIDLLLVPVEDLQKHFNNLSLSGNEQEIAGRLLKEIQNRLTFLTEVGLGYLTLNRLTSTLSGGEHQRIKLATNLGSALVGSMYILDEPSIGLHSKDTHQLIKVLKRLKDLGNTVIVVEHEEDIIRSADELIDIGKDAGTLGGNLTYQGTIENIPKDSDSYTGKYLTGELNVEIPKKRRTFTDSIKFENVSENNLQNIDVEIPLHTLTCITGVSGSGKSTLVKKVIYPALRKLYSDYNEFTGKFGGVVGSTKQIEAVELIDQNPIGKSSRSNPVTYLKAYDDIRNLFSSQDLAKQRAYKPASFSFNVDGGRCDNCKGEGTIKVEMQFMADLHLICDSCNGKRFKKEVLEVTYDGKSISDVLNMTVDDALYFFRNEKKILEKLKPLEQVGLGYITLGQSSNSLSGGEAQRVKLAYYLAKGKTEKRTLFIFDEPTTGLHFHDIHKLLFAINALVDHGHSAIIIEHNLDVIKTADWVIDLGPEGGIKGGTICFEGTPEDLAKQENNHTGKYLKEKISD